MKFLFLMDPLYTVDYDKDTTFALMLGAKEAGHAVFYLPKDGMSLRNGRLHFHITRVVPQRVRTKPFLVKDQSVVEATEIDALFVRTDPPFNAEYLMHTWLLDQVPASVAVLNNPQGIRTVNEKVWAAQFTTIVPPTLVSRRRTDLLDFVKTYKNVVAKPTDGHGGRAVFRVAHGDKNTNVTLETLTHNYSVDIILQEYIPHADKGDKRILLLNGEPLGAVLRVHSRADHRNNFFSGGKPQKAKITDDDLRVIEILRPHLRALGLSFVGIDLLGPYLTEVNVTSPTGLQEMNRLTRQKLERKVITFAEEMVRNKSPR